MLTGLSADDMKSSLITLDEMARKLGATTTVLRERSVRKDKKVAEVLVRKVFILNTVITNLCV